MRVTPIRRWTPDGWIPASRLFHYLEQLVVALGVYEDATSTIPSGFPTLSTGAAGRLVQAAESVRYEVRALTAPPAEAQNEPVVYTLHPKAAAGGDAPMHGLDHVAALLERGALRQYVLDANAALDLAGTSSDLSVVDRITALAADRDGWHRQAKLLAGLLNDCDDGDPCTHPGALGPCMPRASDGRCIWCERELPPASGRPKDCDDGDPGTGAP